MPLSIALGVLAAAPAPVAGAAASMPHLRRQGTAIQLVVDGKPFLIRGGELGNSAASSPDSLRPSWARFAELNMNTVLAPVYWELIEPEEGRLDFSTLDRLVADARGNGMRLVLLWFGSWKNSMSGYAPAWVKRDSRRFPRATDLDGTRQEILSPFSAENRDADPRAFAALQGHLRETDEASRTVLMVRVENEIEMIPTARDHSAEADRAFASAVPGELMADLAARREELAPELRALWLGAGGKASGTWSDVFGPGPAGSTSRTSPSGPGATRGRATRCSSRRRCAARRPRSTGTTRSASRLSASSRSASRPRSTWRPATTSWRSSSPCWSSGRARVMTAGLLSEGEEQRQPQQVRLNGYVLAATFEPPPSGGLVLATAPDEFVVAGTAVTITFASATAGQRVGILSAEEGRFAALRWEGSRRLNGDETHQGRHVRLEPGRFSMQRVRLYLY
jgi:hypothetical protein